jgi:segregation and condensation protein A
MDLAVKIDVFEGPLDLLLHLIDKNKVTITDIPIALITDQYMAYIAKMENNRMDIMSEFIEMAATLISIKTRMLLPQKTDENDELIDPRQELMEQLLEYKKYKLMAEGLRSRHLDAGQVFYKNATIPEEISSYVPKVDTDDLLKDLDFSMLYGIFQQLMKKNKDKIDPIRSQFGIIKRETFTVHDKMADILLLRKAKKKFSFKDLLEDVMTRSEMIAIFLAILELMKVSKIKVVQSNVFHDIDIEFI